VQADDTTAPPLAATTFLHGKDTRPSSDASKGDAGEMTEANADADAIPVAARIALRRAAHRSARTRGCWADSVGEIAGASDDDPSGIATYSQTGAQFGYAMCWVMLFSFPVMVAPRISAHAWVASPARPAISAGRDHRPLAHPYFARFRPL
jgi:hypothetical protein